MTKKELIQRISRDCRLTRNQATRALNSIARNLAAGISRKGRMQFAGLGTFSVTRKVKRTGRHPQTGQRIRLRRRRTVQFTPARALQRRIS
jgi:DNA-binding protein HU-beta